MAVNVEDLMRNHGSDWAVRSSEPDGHREQRAYSPEGSHSAKSGGSAEVSGQSSAVGGGKSAEVGVQGANSPEGSHSSKSGVSGMDDGARAEGGGKKPSPTAAVVADINPVANVSVPEVNSVGDAAVSRGVLSQHQIGVDANGSGQSVNLPEGSHSAKSGVNGTDSGGSAEGGVQSSESDGHRGASARKTAPLSVPAGNVATVGEAAANGLAGARNSMDGYDHQIAALRKLSELYSPETDEQRRKRERMERSRKIMAAVTDGLGALGNLYFTTQYAPNMYNHEKQSALSPLMARLERDKVEREKRAGSLYDIAMRIGALENERDKVLYARERDKAADRWKELAEGRSQAKADRDARVAEVRMDLMLGKIDQQKAAARVAQIEAEYADAYWQSKIARNNRVGTAKGNGGKRYYGSLPDKDGKSVDYYSRADYEAALEEPWRNLDSKEEVVTTTVAKTAGGTTRGITESKTTKEKSTAKKAAQAKANTGKQEDSDGKKKKSPTA